MDVEEIKRARVPTELVWKAWSQSHMAHGGGKLENGALGQMSQGKKKGFSYEIANVVPGRSFSTVWKLFLVRLFFYHTVSPILEGSEIRYGFDLKGPLAFVLRPFLLKKIRFHLASALEAFVRKLERSQI